MKTSHTKDISDITEIKESFLSYPFTRKMKVPRQTLN